MVVNPNVETQLDWLAAGQQIRHKETGDQPGTWAHAAPAVLAEAQLEDGE